MTDAESDVLISGGGFAGLALALALGQAGFAVTVVDPAPAAGPAGFDGRVSSIAPDVRRMLERLGVWARIPESQSVTDIVVSGGVVGGEASAFFLHFEKDDGGAPPFDMVENRFLLAALGEAVAACPSVERLTETRIETVETAPARITVTLSGGGRRDAPLLVAAEGRDSPLRERFGIKVTGWSYDQWGIVTTVEHERPHDGVAQEYFLPSGSFAILPMTGRRASLVWTERSDLARTVMAMDEGDFAAEVARRFTDYLGQVRPVGARSAFPLALQLARTFVAPRFALIGDAAV